MQAANKKKVAKDEWERKVSAVDLRKEDLNQLVMNFLVTEVRVVAEHRCKFAYTMLPAVYQQHVTGYIPARRIGVGAPTPALLALAAGPQVLSRK